MTTAHPTCRVRDGQHLALPPPIPLYSRPVLIGPALTTTQWVCSIVIAGVAVVAAAAMVVVVEVVIVAVVAAVVVGLLVVMVVGMRLGRVRGTPGGEGRGRMVVVAEVEAVVTILLLEQK